MAVQKKPEIEPLAELHCSHCKNGGGGSCKVGGNRDVFCITAQQVLGSVWLPMASARGCTGPAYMQHKLITTFMQGGAESSTPPDS